MKLRTCAILAISVLTVIVSAAAQDYTVSQPILSVVPRMVKFSGAAKDETGKPISGILGVTFALYKDEQGGAPLWLETQNVQADVNGHYTVMLGAASANGIPLDIFSSAEAHWMSTRVSDQSESARVLLLSVPYALKAVDAETLGGLPASAFVQANPAAGVSSTNARNAAASAATISGSGTTDFIPLWNSSTALGNSLVYQSNGMLGVGTKAPKSTIDVHSTVTAVSGTSTGAGKAGLYGLSPGFGVQGIGNGTTSTGVSGTGAQYGMTGTAGNDQPNAAGVYGTETSSTSGYPVYGVEGLVKTSQKGIGVYGVAQAITGPASGVFGKTASAGGAGGLFQNTSTATGAKILVAEDSSGTQRFSVDSQGNVNVVTGTTTQVKGPLLPVNHARETVAVSHGDNLITLDWAFPFPDTSYTASCSYVSDVSFESGTGVWGLQINSVSATSVELDVASYSNISITVHCIGVHD